MSQVFLGWESLFAKKSRTIVEALKVVIFFFFYITLNDFTSFSAPPVVNESHIGVNIYKNTHDSVSMHYSVKYRLMVFYVHSQVTVLFAGQQIPKSPFEVNVDKALGDATKVTAKGPGLEPLGNFANKPTTFDIYTAGLTVQA